MTPQTVYEPSTTKRSRLTKAGKEQLIGDLRDIVAEKKPMTLRQVFYQATVHGFVEKTEAGYRQVQRMLVEMRRSGELPYSFIADNTRSVYREETFDSPADALTMTAHFYRKALWSTAPVRVEVWHEKDALSGVISSVTKEYDVGLYVARGFASLSFLYSAAEVIRNAGKPTFIYHLGDRDPSGVMAGDKIAETLHDLAPDADIRFERLAVTKDQIDSLDLPTRPTKASCHAAGWMGDSVELDAIEPCTLRAIVREAIERHLPLDRLRVLKAAEESEKSLITRWAEGVN